MLSAQSCKKIHSRSNYDKELDPKKIRHYYVDGSYNPDTGIASSAILAKGWGFKPYTIVKQYRGKKCSSTYAEHRAIDSAIEDAKNRGLDLTHVIIHADQKGIVSGIGKLSVLKERIEGYGIRLKYLPSVHEIDSNSTKREINAYTVNELANKSTRGYGNRYCLYFNKRRRKRKNRQVRPSRYNS